MQHTRGPVFVVLAVLALSSLGVSSQSERDQDQFQNQDLDLELRHHRLLQRARSAGLLSQDLNKRAIENMLAHILEPEAEAEAEREAELVSMTSGGRTNLERSVDTNVPPRNRKDGCKNFYWKGFTSC